MSVGGHTLVAVAAPALSDSPTVVSGIVVWMYVDPGTAGLVRVPPVHVISVPHRTREYWPVPEFGSPSTLVDAGAPPAVRVVPSVIDPPIEWTEPSALEICSC